MIKTEALELVGNLAKASIRSYEVVNRMKRGSSDKACNDELKAAMKLLAALGIHDATATEVHEALGN